MAVALGTAQFAFDDAVGVRVGERLEQHCVHDRKDGGVGADAEGQRRNGGNRETRES